MVSVDIVAIIITIIGLAAALTARKTWLLVEGDLAESWRWILPSVPIYATSFIVLILHNFLQRYAVSRPVVSLVVNLNLADKQTGFKMQIWEPIILVLKNIQVLSELLFLILVLIGLTRQYRLFKELSSKQ
ncbi:MAG: hypothetical protein COW32_01430 [Candidatus Aquicultor secundus]|uniref:Uncharacterized protein n=1 Tax=Candidatus Aquicultor secundus TaxID=1973895 RepID=A0A2M7TCC3_9ACTN|nr:hypothetical protein [Candidatus Aquicultor secundus]NCO66236.1 hypothetical protein [Solirubrobacter sp.]OIO84200.1 MAG: hypothetical protein AUK32_09025 [Candidatus Aquicultor secundus]PIU26375.1 MAG: hypothetical protein COT10_08975 [Candidatus Aquicultor secundus]PIW23038.1 MAG: hypothetical protein COW32_01430 [Candidatus Aquicultor secundus]PIX52691.1 MAG: hypothetical protein COZ51_02835 [Candidatus Aquicultor secundus]